MEAKQKPLYEFLRDKQQLTIPIYQRSYNWTLKQCEKLWDDIKEISNNSKSKNHFLGSIVRIKEIDEKSEISKYVVIDGQQRISTITLLLASIVLRLEKARATELREDYLINHHQTDELRYKLLLTEPDKESIKTIVEKKENTKIKSEQIEKNYEYFLSKIKNEDPEKIISAIRKLTIVDITLNSNQDDPQIIFESLNSTGLDLSQVDLIRNFLLMGLSREDQEYLYSNYWREMEKEFGQTNYRTYFDKFMRDYLSLKTGSIPKINSVYEVFKKYFHKVDGTNNTKEILADLYSFSCFYTKLALAKEQDTLLKQEFNDLKELKVDVSYPFLLQIYYDFDQEIISRDELLEILAMVQSFVFRRFICEIKTNSLNSLFLNLYSKINKGDYILSLKSAFANMDSYRRFPDDDEFSNSLKRKDMYNISKKKFWLSKYENYGRKENVPYDEYSVEHIMPQSPDLSNEWQRMLGNEWETIHKKYLHTIGNLTLTRYNPELSNKSFHEKKTMNGGFNKSPLNLNESLQGVEVWNEDAIKERADILVSKIIKIWKPLDISDDDKNKYKLKPLKEKKLYTRKDHKYLSPNSPMTPMFDAINNRILSLDSRISSEYTKHYVAYKSITNFVDLIPLKSKLLCILNVDITDIDDPKGLCSDVSTIGTWGNGNTRTEIKSQENVDDVMKIIEQVFDYVSET